ncbi:MAG: threonine synthase [Planctomycetes bacterium]|nr:threonine synthase [Planctomycetota bacterium]
MSEIAFQQCIHTACAETYAIDQALFGCPKCGNLLDIRYDWDRVPVPTSLDAFNRRWGTPGRSTEARADFSGVWRFRELLPFAHVDELATIGEGRTILQQADQIAKQLGLKPARLFLQYEGFNPTGSFKDNGMAAAFTIARKLGKRRVACASTGNTSAAMTAFAAQSGDAGAPMQAIVFVGEGKIAFGKLAQALDYGALTLQIAGDFDACMRRAVECANELDVYLMNSLNPFRLEGQKAIMYRVLEGLDWQVPDWIIVPGGNLGNSSAFGKAFMELKELGLIDRIPRIAIINATGAKTLHEAWTEKKFRWCDGAFDAKAINAYFETLDATNRKAKTIASAIEIGRPVNLTKALRTLDVMNGVVRHVPDDMILSYKALIGRYGYGCEPASAASLAGLKLLREEGMIGPDDKVACILTGHALKDPDATVKFHTSKESGPPESSGAAPNQPIKVADEFEAIKRIIETNSE